MSHPRLPYFDLLLEGRRRDHPAAAAMSRFVHWGYWEDASKAARTAEDFSAAMERLNAELLRAAELQDGQSVLDAGCGFGGTLASIDHAHKAMRLTGLNIDPRQLEVAREMVKNRPGNTLRWVEGDACKLPFADDSFDRLLAVECIFHFPSRFAFVKEAARVLKSGGRLALSDFSPREPGGPSSWLGEWLGREISRGYGALGSGWPDGDYPAMASAAGLEVVQDHDITRHTLPTYPVLMDLLKEADGTPQRDLLWSTRVLYWASWLDIVRYRVVAFRKP